MFDPENYKLGETDNFIVVSTRDECREIVEAMSKHICRTLEIYSYDLDASLYDSAIFVDALQEIIKDNKNAQIRVLTKDSTNAVQNGHRIVAVAQKFTSYIEIRKVNSAYLDLDETFMIADQRGILLRDQPDRFEGIANFNSPRKAKILLATFNEVWERSDPDPEVRRLRL